MHPALEPFEPGPGRPWDFDAAAHLWRRPAFGAPPARIERSLAAGLPGAVEEIVSGPAEDAAARELDSIYPSVLGSGDEDLARAWLLSRMTRCGHQLREKLALFWHGHFATSIRKVRRLDWMLRQYRLFLGHGLGRFGVLLDAVTRDPAMIRWLDNETNEKGRPNENYARELFELFTLGVGNYSEADIREAARAFTGWHILRGRFHLSKMLHDDGVKTVLGRTGRFDGGDICRIALEQEACGRFLARKLLRFFVRPDPEPEIVAGLGAVLRANGYDLTATLGVLFRSRYFFAPRHRGALVKSPVEYVVGAVRTLDLPFPAADAVPGLRAMGQELLAPPNVKGWPGHRAWIDTTTWLARVEAARGIAARAAGATTPPLDRVAAALLGRPPPAEERRFALDRTGAGQGDLVLALLSLPEAHLS